MNREFSIGKGNSMDTRIEFLRNHFIVEKKHHANRKPPLDKYAAARGYGLEGFSDMRRATERLGHMLANETPIVLPEERITITRTLVTIPELHTEEEWAVIRAAHHIHEAGKICNICPDYASVIDRGFAGKRMEIAAAQKQFASSGNQAAMEYLDCTLTVLDQLESFSARYGAEAKRVGNTQLTEVFAWIPQNRPRTFQEALQFFRLLHFGLWFSGNYHNTIGRFDQFMFPYLQADLDNGTLAPETALELVEEFFLSFNKDSDLYPGMQQGDNGQSLVLGGLNPDGTDSFNLLSDLCLKACMALRLIDPKINLRVHGKTPQAMYEQATHLTKLGLGFPQYTNDDVAIPALLLWGYEPEDAYNYVMAACWEVIIPGCAMDVPNISALSFPESLVAVMAELPLTTSFDALMDRMRDAIHAQTNRITSVLGNLYLEPSPLISLMMDTCISRGSDVSNGCRYNNYGIHGTGLSTAVDSLAAIRQYVFEEKRFTGRELLNLLEGNFDGNQDLVRELRENGPKFGNDEESVDSIASSLLGWFADSLQNRKNDRGGIFRAGTGSAMYYLWHAKSIGATPDGRYAGDPLAANYSPSLTGHCRGPVSILKSFAKPPLVRVANGGPLTMELHDSVFRTEESIGKVARFVRSYFELGGLQMQINAVNRDTLLEAKKHPEQHRELIVRVWGWSGHFVELDEEYQDHILKRMEWAI